MLCLLFRRLHTLIACLMAQGWLSRAEIVHVARLYIQWECEGRVGWVG